ncbi:MAG: DegT/DnrJ/EryC1/StrS family aminotransferase [Planctomycetota bacterium]|nr:DegT/DnrJ/EryC1/StrS family aminotransferase [Planctomycetota bacterium]
MTTPRRIERLAALGGRRVIPEGAMKPWPPIGKLDRELVLASLEGGQHTYGPNYTALENEFAAWSGIEHVQFCNSGTAALHMALVACQCGAGDEVIAPAYTWPSSATCCLHHNIIPVFVDIEWVTMNLDPAKIEAAITPRTKAIIVVHLHGLMVNMTKVMALAKKHGLKVIEDCCQGHGATFRGRPAGSWGHAAAFSTNQNKIMCSGEGGFFCSNDKATFERGKTLWYFGENRPPEASAGYHAYGMGWMYRSSDMVAAFARAQLTRLDDNLARIRANAASLTECLADVPHLILPATPRGHSHNYYNYTVRFDMAAMGHTADARAFRDKLVAALRAEGLDTGIWQGWPVPEMTALQAKDAYGRGCPWSCRHAAPVNYSLDQFPVARRHCDWHTGMTTPLRPPNGVRMAGLTARAFRKVLTNLDQVDQIK